MSVAEHYIRRPHDLAPMQILLLCGVIALAIFFSSLWLVTRAPSIGISWVKAETGPGMLITQVFDGPAQDRLVPGDTIVALEANGNSLPITDISLYEDPDFSPSYEEYNRFFQNQEKLYSLLHQNQITLLLADGRRLDITPNNHTPWTHIPLKFWIMHIFGIFALYIGIGVWCFRRGEIATRLFALSGIGCMVGITCAATYISREITMDPQWFYSLAAINHLGNMIMGYSIMALLWYYPQRLARASIVIPTYSVLLVIWFNEVIQFIELPYHAFYLQYNFPFSLGVCFAIAQWYRSNRKPLERAALKWFLLTILISFSLIILFFVTPVIFKANPIVSLFAANGIIFLMYVSLALGVSRFRLFKLERWWLATWTWFLGGLMVILFDLILLYILNLQPQIAFGMAILIAGWLYFPIRQWVWLKVVRSPKKMLDHYLPDLMNMFILSTSVKELNNQWRLLLTRIFDPLDVKEKPQIISKSEIQNNGISLVVPSVNAHGSIVLSCGNRGARLFSPEDVELVNAILGLAQKSANIHEAQEKGANIERNRIMRDLHDDVGAKLLTLCHKADSPDQAMLAQSALQSLRDTIYSINDPETSLLVDALADWRAELQDRVESAAIVFEWQQDEMEMQLSITSRQRTNLGRVLNEIVSNAMRHSNTDRIRVEINFKDSKFRLSVHDFGDSSNPNSWTAGTGMNNIRSRILEMGGEVEWLVDNKNSLSTGTRVELRLPWEYTTE